MRRRTASTGLTLVELLVVIEVNMMEVTGMSTERQPRCNGFTLIELLVVIGIIAILAAISFAVFIHVKESGRQVQCLSNVRQLAQATLMYAPENGGLLPPFVNKKARSNAPDINP